MMRNCRVGALALFSLLLACGTAAAQQQAASDQAAVWAVIEDQWERNEGGDTNWIDDLLSADFVGWPRQSPAPQTRSSIRMWDAFTSKQTETLEHELFPLSIVVHGDTAIAHYLYTNATSDKKGEVKISNGRYTDVLVKVEGQWKFISWHGGDDSSGNSESD